MKVLLVITNIGGFHEVPYHFGLSSIFSYIKAKGHNTEIISIRSKNEYDLFEDKVKIFQPNIVGFTSVSSQFNVVKELSIIVKKIDKDVFNVCGGVHPTLYSEDLLSAEHIDVFFVGESEIAFGDFIDKIEKGKDFKDTNNIVYKNNGVIKKNPLNPLVQELDGLPFPVKDSLFEEFIITNGYAPFFFSRGCPFQCSYCSNHSLAQVYGLSRNYPRYRSVDSCIDEIKDALSKYKFYTLWIMDDTFGLNKKWREEFCDKYLNEISLRFCVLLRPNVVDEELISSLKHAGCFRIMFGVESGNDYVRNQIMNRNITTEQIVHAFGLCKKYNIESCALNIIGVPGETDEMIWDTINLNRKLQPTSSGLNIFYPYKGTQLGDRSFSEGLVDLKMYSKFSNERRDSVLLYPDEHRRRLIYYHQNWEHLVYPYNIKKRANAILMKHKYLYNILKRVKHRICS